MRIFYDIPAEKGVFNNPVLTIGTFDGVHLGHKEIFKKLLAIAREKNTDPVVLTFDTHPRKVINPNTPPRILTTSKEKIWEISESGINNIIIMKFTREIAQMHAVDFLNKMIIEKMGIGDLVTGYDNAFGKNRDGDYSLLSTIAEEKGFDITRVESLNFLSRPVSSTWIRTEIEDGNIALANTLLGRNYTLSGSVVKGENRGIELGFPTANIMPEDPDKVVPKDGVYAVRVLIKDDPANNESKDGMLNIGTNPTFSNMERTIEVNIFNFNEYIYGKNLEIEFYERIRDEIEFDSSEALIKQLNQDKQSVQDSLKRFNLPMV